MCGNFNWTFYNLHAHSAGGCIVAKPPSSFGHHATVFVTGRWILLWKNLYLQSYGPHLASCLMYQNSPRYVSEHEGLASNSSVMKLGFILCILTYPETTDYLFVTVEYVTLNLDTTLEYLQVVF